ncbi:MAG: TIGR00269 family protein [Candidatus Diapherotrites archaeon]|nr:TIGR00269 family protein [Candidatus Diapherotrites archaeon]
MCERCADPAKVHLPYGPHRFCAQHFNAFFEKRVRETISNHRLFRPGDPILLALSGGKDSMVLLHVLHQYYSKTNSIAALLIDEGIEGYRARSIEQAVAYCDQLGVSHTVVSHANEFGFTNDQYASLVLGKRIAGKSVCAYCGTFRNTLMNRYAKKQGAAALATGHNLDDEAQNVLLNVLDNHFEKMQNHSARSDSLSSEFTVPRIKPLYETPEKDIIAYANLNSIPHYSDECCPYSYAAKRNDARFLLNNLEQKYPGTKHSVMGFLQEMKKEAKTRPPRIGQKRIVSHCANCQEPANAKYCQACTKQQVIQTALAKKSPIAQTLPVVSKDALTCYETKRM